MNKKYIIGGIAIAIFIIIAILSFNESKIEYSDFESARNSDKYVQIIGTVVRDADLKYDPQENILQFRLRDEENNTALVRHNGSKPNNFDIAPMLVVKGKFDGEVFAAREIYTKCPSKYEGELKYLENE
jgi:cytochrome c-type biogenesis protein CcmE